MTEKQYFYQNKLFSVEEDLFYENCKRIGYFEDEEEYEIKRNNYKKTVDRLEELRECNIYLKRLNKKFKRENEQLKKELKRCRDWLNSDKNDYELTLAFIKNKGYSLKDVLKYEKELKKE